MNKTAYKKLLEDICLDYCNKDKWCILKEFLVKAHLSPRLLSQMKCLEILKWELSKKFDREYTWERTILFWTDGGYAKLFADMYTEDISPKKLYRQIMKVKPI